MRMESSSYVPMNELASIGRSQLQKRSDITRLYSQAAGLTDMLMNDDQGAMQPKLIEFSEIDLYRSKNQKWRVRRGNRVFLW